jgi:hypothetical protein
MDDLIDRSRRDADRAAHGVLRNPHRLEVLLKQDLAGCDRIIHHSTCSDAPSRVSSTSMVVDYCDLLRAGIGPPEDDAPLGVDPNGVKPHKRAAERLETVAGWHVKVSKVRRPVQLDQSGYSVPDHRFTIASSASP